jgi:hypothetical protein
MNFEEESFLTAYFDGELASATRERVESALRTDPALADDLETLAALRDLVAGLSRPPSPVDTSAAVVARLRLRARRSPLLYPFGAFRRVSGRDLEESIGAIRIVAVVATAAALLAAVSLGLLRRATGPEQVAQRIAPPRPSPNEPLPDVSEIFAQNWFSSAALPVASNVEGDEQTRAQEQRGVRQLLDSPNLHKVFVVTDVLGGNADRKVSEIVESTPRRRSTYGRITVAQGIVLDPEHPGKATVYAIVMDDREITELRGLLRNAFRSAVRESDPRPETVTQLADIGQVAVLPGTAVAELRDIGSSERERAILTTPGKVATSKSALVPSDGFDPLNIGATTILAGPDDGPTLEQMRSGPHPSLRDLNERAENPSRPTVVRSPSATPTSPRDDRPNRTPFHVVLVWVETPTESVRR